MFSLVWMVMLGCPVVGQTRDAGAAARVFADLNQARQEQHLPLLRMDVALARAADEHTQRMAQQDTLGHVLPGEPSLAERIGASGARVSAMAENVGFSTEGADGVHDAWMHSPGHRANILSAEYDVVGVSVYEAHGKLYATEDFGRAVTAISADDAEVTVRDAIAAERAAHRMPVLRVSAMKSGADCSTATPSLPSLMPGQARSVVNYTSFDPKILPQIVKERVTDGRYSSYFISVCESHAKPGFTSVIVHLVFTN